MAKPKTKNQELIEIAVKLRGYATQLPGFHSFRSDTIAGKLIIDARRVEEIARTLKRPVKAKNEPNLK